MKELKAREELAEINRQIWIAGGVGLLGALCVGAVAGSGWVHHWDSLAIGLMVFFVIVGVAGLVGALRLDTKRQEYTFTAFLMELLMKVALTLHGGPKMQKT